MRQATISSNGQKSYAELEVSIIGLHTLVFDDG